jgi:CHAT domain-containing protein
MIVYLTLEDRSFAWVIAPDGVALVPLAAGEQQLSRLIEDLRATVNPKEVQGLGDIRPFDLAGSRKLFRLLVEPLGLGPEARHLLVIPDGTLQSLPFAALLEQDAGAVDDFGDYRQLAWLIRSHDLTVLPEVGALRALRAEARPSLATKPFLGIGDPVLTGEAVKDPQTVGDLIRMLAPLPESADELEALATAMKSGPESVITGAAATELAVKAMALGDYRVLAFATHGLMAGDFGRLREPGLVLTPPDVATGDDDGLLTVREISSLKLDADWVLLSACNTAAGDGSPGAEGLSGLARAFFFAGSRALLVSQWEVLSVAAVQLTTGTLDRMAAEPGMRRATALQQAMLALLGEDQDDYLAHPIFWAPFELVGEGGAALR